MPEKKILFILICINIFLILSTAAYGITRPSTNLTFSPEELSVFSTNADNQEVSVPGYYLDNAIEGSGKYIATPSTILNKGIFNVSVKYQTNNAETDFCKTWAVTDSNNYQALLCDHVPLYRNDTEVQYHIYLNQNNQNIIIKCILLDNSPNYIKIDEINITSSNFLFTISLILKCIFYLIVFDCIILLYFNHSLFQKTQKQDRIVIFGLISTVILASYPVFSDYLINGHDLTFHLMRIEGLKNGLMSLTFPVRIQPNWLENHGYPVSIFYGDILLYFPAVLRIIGISIQDAYRFFVIIVHIATALTAYFCFHKMTHNKYIGLCGSILYTLNPYLLSDVYIRSSVGEYTAIIFLPLILYGLWKIYTEDENSPSYKHNWIIPAIGFSGIIETHIISTELVGLTTILACLLLFKYTFRKKTFFVLCKTVFFTLLLNAWFLIPFFSMFGSEMNVHVRDSLLRIQERGAFPFQPFSTEYGVSGLSNIAANGAVNEFPLSIGFSLTAVLLMFCCYSFIKRKIIGGVHGKIALVLTCFTLFCSTTLFPYDMLASHSRILERVFSSIQFPWRFLEISILFITWMVCIILLCIIQDYPKHWKKLTAGIILLLCIFTGSQSLDLMGQIMNELPTYRIYDNEPLLTPSIGAGEYLIADTDTTQLFTEPSSDGNMEIENYSQAYNNVTLTVRNLSAKENYVDAPLLYYKGYIAYDESSKEKFTIGFGDNNRLRVYLPGEYNGTLNITYQEPLFWRLSELISICSILFVIFLLIRKRNPLFLNISIFSKKHGREA